MKEWISGWGYRECDFSLFPIWAEDETQRLWFYSNLSSDTLRLRFSNRYGRYELPIEQVNIACSNEYGEIIPGTDRAVLFEGSDKVVLQSGEIRYSDPVSFPAKPGSWISISIYIRERTRITCAISSQSSHITRMSCQKGGNYCSAPVVSGERFLGEARDFMELKPLYNVVAAALTQVEFLCQDTEKIRTVTVFGDSITQHGNWSEALTKRLYDAYPGQVAVINRGICGNRILHDASIRSKFGAYFGEGALERFWQDVYETPGNRVDCILVEEGVNDIIQPFDGTCPQYEKVTAEEILEGYAKMAETAHENDTVIFGATVMPFRGFNAVWNEETERRRNKVNEGLKKEQIFDHVFDFASVICDEDEPSRLNPVYNCGDNLHPNVKGGQAIADMIDLNRIMEK